MLFNTINYFIRWKKIIECNSEKILIAYAPEFPFGSTGACGHHILCPMQKGLF